MFRVLLSVDSNIEHGMHAAKLVTNLPGPSDQLEVTILNIQSEINATGAGIETTDSKDRFDEDKYPEAVRETERFLLENSISTDKIRRYGDPSKEILDVAAEIEADRIILSGGKRSPAGKMIFGSTIQSVLLDSDIPVTVTLD